MKEEDKTGRVQGLANEQQHLISTHILRCVSTFCITALTGWSVLVGSRLWPLDLPTVMVMLLLLITGWRPDGDSITTLDFLLSKSLLSSPDCPTGGNSPLLMALLPSSAGEYTPFCSVSSGLENPSVSSSSSSGELFPDVKIGLAVVDDEATLEPDDIAGLLEALLLDEGNCDTELLGEGILLTGCGMLLTEFRVMPAISLVPVLLLGICD